MGLPRTYDAIFRRYAGRVPVNYLRALAKRESNFNPHDTNGPAWGLMQVVEVVRNDYNSRHGTSYSRQDLLNPDINVMIAAELLNRIVDSYERNHPDVPAMQPTWSPEHAKLVTAGWNAGYSEAGGVGRVADYLVAHGIPVTHANVYQYAGAAGATQHLQNPQREWWQKTVVDLFYQEGGPGLPVWATVGVAALVGYGLYRWLT